MGLVRIVHSSAPPPDDTEFGVKYRFIEQDKAGWVPSVGHLPVARGPPGRCGARSRYWQDPCFRAALGSKGLRRLDDLWRRRLLDQSRPRQQELLVRGLGDGAQDHRQTYARRRIVPSDARCDRRCVGDRFQLRQRAVDGFHAEFTISPIAIISFFRLEKVSSTPRRRTNSLGISGS